MVSRSIIGTQGPKMQAIMRAIMGKYKVTELEAMNLAFLGGGDTKTVLNLCKAVLSKKKK